MFAGVRRAVYEEPLPEKLEREPLATEISARVKSAEDSDNAKEMSAVLPTSTEEEEEEIAMVGGVVSGGGVMEKASELLESLPSLLKFPAASEKELLATEMEA